MQLMLSLSEGSPYMMNIIFLVIQYSVHAPWLVHSILKGFLSCYIALNLLVMIHHTRFCAYRVTDGDLWRVFPSTFVCMVRKMYKDEWKASIDEKLPY